MDQGDKRHNTAPLVCVCVDDAAPSQLLLPCVDEVT